MEMRNEMDAGEAFVSEAVAAAPTRPSRPSRPDGAKRSARPMLLNNPIEATGTVVTDKAETPVAKMERPSRPKTERRARVLEPDQVAASRGEDYEPPSSEARDAMLGADDSPATSKVGAVFQSIGQIVSGLKKSKVEDDASKDVIEPMKAEQDAEDTPKTSKIAGILNGLKRSKKAAKDAQEPVEMALDDPSEVEPKAAKSGGVLAGLMAFKKPKADPIAEDEMIVEPSFEVQSEDFDAAEDIDGMPEIDPAFIPAKPSMMARFDTPLMGVLAAVAVSFVGLVGASALFG